MRSNRILAALSERNRDALKRGCVEVQLRFGETISVAGRSMPHVYFPLNGFVSQLAEVSEGGRLEVALVGSEGMLGASVVLGMHIQPHHAIVQGAGNALRMRTEEFARHCGAGSELGRQLGKYVFVQLQQLALTAVCTRFHVVEARLARWLLTTRDRAHADRFYLTHEYLAMMLGVRRVGVTQAAGALQARGLLAYSRGNVEILSAAGLKDASCSCYRRGNEIYERVLGKTTIRKRDQSTDLSMAAAR
ncbi:MAG TPA: Crp/Fnr family transcriptional regulator [Steroidobacteraceae bacterium]|nr:Crp/Fnr family transcriptional regulator [Steroidobacteraceae bacterium]